MLPLLRAIDELSDVQAVTAARHLGRRIFSVVTLDVLRPAPPAGELDAMPSVTKSARLDSTDSAGISKHLLRAFAMDRALAPVVTEIVDEVRRDESVFIEHSIVVGEVVNLTMFMASSELEFKFRNGTIKKGPISAAMLKTILEPVVEVVKKKLPIV